MRSREDELAEKLKGVLDESVKRGGKVGDDVENEDDVLKQKIFHILDELFGIGFDAK